MQFATRGEQSYLTLEQSKILVEKLQELHAKKVFNTDTELLHQSMEFHVPILNPPIGMILISSNKEYLLCGTQLQLR